MQERRVFLASKVGLLLAFAVACGGSQQQVAKPAPSIVLSDPGAEPRQRLRYERQLHVPEHAEISIKLHLASALTNTVLETGHKTIDFPTARFVGRIEATGFTPAGDTMISCEIEDATVLDDVADPAVVTPFAAAIQAIKGWRSEWRVSPSGAQSEITFDAPNATPAMRERATNLYDAMREASVVFPDTEIGIGATWQVTSQISLQGVMWDRKVTYRLRGFAGSTATVETSISMHAASQALRVEPNRITRLTSGTMNATSDLTIPLHGLVPSGTDHGTAEANLSIVSGHLRIVSTLTTEESIAIQPLGAAAEHGP